MTTSLFANPGQTITIALQITDGYGQLADGYQAATVDFILLPSGSYASDYPADMTEITTGIWKYTFTVQSGLTGVGSYVISCSYPSPDDPAIFMNELFLLNVALPFGLTSIAPG